MTLNRIVIVFYLIIFIPIRLEVPLIHEWALRCQLFHRMAYSSAVVVTVVLGAGNKQMHIATRDLNIAFRNGEVINPVERGHIAFRTDDIEAYKRHLDEHGVHYSDYGSVFAAEWHQLFFLDPEVSACVDVRLRTRGGLVAWLRLTSLVPSGYVPGDGRGGAPSDLIENYVSIGSIDVMCSWPCTR